MPVSSDEEIARILTMNSIAVVGCSSMPHKDAHRVPRYLQNNGYTIIPVNPNASEVLGREPYDSLADVEESIDIVNVFRPSDEVAGIVHDVLERDDVAVIWLQLGIHDDQAVTSAESHGIQVVENKCMMVEHRRLTAA